MAGGGGFGDPLERFPQSVRDDVLDGKVSREHAMSAYGVVIDAHSQVDLIATQAERERLRGIRQHGIVQRGAPQPGSAV
jgi:N-methylhydantoinase B